MYSGGFDDEAACLRTAVDLLERSDAYAVSDPRLARQYARQAYGLGRRSPRLLQSIAHARIRMIIQASDRRRMEKMLDAVQLPRIARLAPWEESRHHDHTAVGRIIFDGDACRRAD